MIKFEIDNASFVTLCVLTGLFILAWFNYRRHELNLLEGEREFGLDYDDSQDGQDTDDGEAEEPHPLYKFREVKVGAREGRGKLADVVWTVFTDSLSPVTLVSTVDVEYSQDGDKVAVKYEIHEHRSLMRGAMEDLDTSVLNRYLITIMTSDEFYSAFPHEESKLLDEKTKEHGLTTDS